MTNPHFARFAVFIASAIVALLLFFQFNGWAGIAAFVAMFIVGGIVSEMLFRRLATPEQKIADLEDRVRNPPS